MILASTDPAQINLSKRLQAQSRQMAMEGIYPFARAFLTAVGRLPGKSQGTIGRMCAACSPGHTSKTKKYLLDIGALDEVDGVLSINHQFVHDLCVRALESRKNAIRHTIAKGRERLRKKREALQAFLSNIQKTEKVAPGEMHTSKERLPEGGTPPEPRPDLPISEDPFVIFLEKRGMWSELSQYLTSRQ